MNLQLPCEICGKLTDIQELEICTLCTQTTCPDCLPTCQHAIDNYIESLEETEDL